MPCICSVMLWIWLALRVVVSVDALSRCCGGASVLGFGGHGSHTSSNPPVAGMAEPGHCPGHGLPLTGHGLGRPVVLLTVTARAHPDVAAIEARFAWARNHLQMAQSILQDWHDANNPHTVIHDYDNKSREVVLRVTGAGMIPSIQLSLILSDGIHQLRTCLDNLFWACTDSFGLSMRGHFPIKEEGAAWRSFEVGIADRVPPDFIRILDEVQPYHAGPDGPSNHLVNDPLYQLQKLSNKDKHRALRIVLASPVETELVYVGPEPRPHDYVRADGEFLRLAIDPEDLRGYNRKTVLAPVIQIPPFQYFPPLSGRGGVTSRIYSKVEQLIAALGVFITGERTAEALPGGAEIGELKWWSRQVPPPTRFS